MPWRSRDPLEGRTLAERQAARSPAQPPSRSWSRPLIAAIGGLLAVLTAVAGWNWLTHTPAPLPTFSQRDLDQYRAIEPLQTGDGEHLSRMPESTCYLLRNSGPRQRPQAYFVAGSGLAYYRRAGALQTCRLTDGAVRWDLTRRLAFDCGATRVTIESTGTASQYQEDHRLTPIRMATRQAGHETRSLEGLWQCFGPGAGADDTIKSLPGTASGVDKAQP